ncbi:MAG: type III-B CRISPR module RAMP protein Cmr1 [Aquificae bacterium]|nr:type III-B CRISPR module RAMP protein Cmr1 [Aquificota bacterium]
MQKIRFKLKVITPMFLSGVDQLVAETRPASLKGILRYWYRILIANKYASQFDITEPDDWMDYEKWANKNLWQKVYEDEGELFGTQDKAGKVWIRMGKIERRLTASDIKKWVENDLGRKLMYIGYGAILSVDPSDPKYSYLRNLYQNGKKVGPVRGYFSPDSKFTEPIFVIDGWDVEFILMDKSYKDKLIGLLWFVSMFGSLGSRSRKGWGSFYLVPKDDDFGFHSWEFTTPEDFRSDLIKASSFLGLESLRNIEIYMSNTLKNNDLVSILLNFSYKYEDFLKNEIEKRERIIFGLPRNLKIFIKDFKRDYIKLLKWALSYVLNKRRASMVHFKIIKIKNEYKIMLIISKSPLFYKEIGKELKAYLSNRLKKEIERLQKKEKKSDKELTSLQVYTRLINDNTAISKVTDFVVKYLFEEIKVGNFKEFFKDWELNGVNIP